ncbi:MAG: DUF1015 family protein [Candidatus Lernaella stagnicola]|nr:DUF1015 family protein [Candidatus Lernaella stagnicola]
MADVRPFRGYRPTPDNVEKVASPPYDVLDSEEARCMAEGNPLSFLHVVKPEIDLPPDTDLYAPIVYETARDNLRRFIDEGILVKDSVPCYYVYQQKMGDHVQVGVMAAVSVVEYDNDLIKKHEHTRKDKEDDRTRLVDVTNANAGPVFLTYQANAGLDALVDEVRAEKPDFDFVAPDGIGHTVWVVNDTTRLKKLAELFAEVPALYVADGHHRSASAARIGRERRGKNPHHTGEEPYNHFLAVLFPDDQLRILDYNRVVTDLNGLTSEQLLDGIAVNFDVGPGSEAKPTEPRTCGMYLDGKWYTLRAKPGVVPENDPVRSLDVQILYEKVLMPLLTIGDPRTDKRINFVGGIRGTAELMRLVDGGGYAVAFAMHPTTIAQLMAIADAGLVMPPKSTWFEPKLRSGVVVRLIED